MSHKVELLADRIRGLLFSLRWYMEFYLAEPDTVLVFEINFGVFGGGTRLANAEDNLRVGLIVIEAWFRGY